MKNYTLQIVTESGEIITESKLKLKPNSKIILTLPKNITKKSAHIIHDQIKNALEGESKLIALIEGIELKVLEIE